MATKQPAESGTHRKRYLKEYAEKNKIRLQEYHKAYRETHREEIRLKSKKYNELHRIYYHVHKEDCRKRMAAYQEAHKDELKEYRKNRNRVYKARFNAQSKQYDGNHKEEKRLYRDSRKETILAQAKIYRTTVRGKLSNRQSKYRRRNLKFNPLNQFITNSHGHHVDIFNVIFIPKYIHQSTPHKQTDEESMQKINILAWAYLEGSVL